MQILGTYTESIIRPKNLLKTVKRRERRENQHLRGDVRHQGLPELTDERHGLGRRVVHFPVPCDESGFHEGRPW